MSNTIQLISDIHGEFHNTTKFIWDYLTPSADILCVCGDIHSNCIEDMLNELSTKFKKVICLLGNHDYYNKDIINNWIPNKELLNDNIIILNRNYYETDDSVFIGCTLWSDFNNLDWFVIDNAKRNINDFYKIKINNNKFTPNDAFDLHQLDKGFLKNTLELFKNTNKKIIVMTHFLPSFSLINEKWKTADNPLNYYFSANCDDIINEYNNVINYWLYGHTHDHTNTPLGDIKFLCNPLGYPNENKRIEDIFVEI